MSPLHPSCSASARVTAISRRDQDTTRRLAAGAAGAALVAATWLAAGDALASENYNLRYAPGIGGSDMSTPLEPGLYGNVNFWIYNAKLENTQAKRTSLGVLQVPTEVDTDVYGLFPRITYVSATRWLGANIGFTAMLPILYRKSDTHLGMPAGVPAMYQPTVGAMLANEAKSDDRTGSASGIGDLELAPLMRWNLDNQQVVFVPAVMLATGDYKKSRVYNPGAGKYTTFRPTVQYSYIGDGWDFGSRVAFSFNTRNSDTDYKSGTMMNIDWELMKFVTDSVRVGAAGYVVQQLTDDDCPAATCTTPLNGPNGTSGVPGGDGNKGRVYGIGPAIGWIKDSGTLLVEGRLYKEFDAKNRPEGTAFWLTVGKPL